MSEKEKGKKSKKKTGLGLAIWILMFLIILIVFLVKQEEIKENFDKSGATALIEKKIGKDIFDDKKNESKSPESEKTTVIDLTKNIKKKESQPKKEQTVTEKADKSEKTQLAEKQAAEAEKKLSQIKKEESKTEVALKPVEKKETVAVEKVQETKKEENIPAKSNSEQRQSQIAQEPKVETKPVTAPAPVVDTNTMKAKICFVALDSDGPVVRKEVTRTVSKDSPLLGALKALLSGPSPNEIKTGCKSYIPPESQLLGVSVKNGVATLNFSEDFQFNPDGPDAANIQLMQIVYTATSFPTVNSVQFLIEGKNIQYLTEGVWIGSPLGRNRF